MGHLVVMSQPDAAILRRDAQQHEGMLQVSTLCVDLVAFLVALWRLHSEIPSVNSLKRH